MCKTSGSLELIFEGSELELDMPLHYYNVKDCSVLDIKVSAKEPLSSNYLPGFPLDLENLENLEK